MNACFWGLFDCFVLVLSFALVLACEFGLCFCLLFRLFVL